MNPNRVLLAMSGGVDSSACAVLLREQGYDVTGLVLKMSPAHEQTVADAQAAADGAGIPLLVRDMTAAFEREVVSYFVDEYARGRTPNPCVLCNPKLKFKALLDAADEEGCAYLATGHYAGLRREGAHTLLTRGEDPARDQSYMLCRLGQDVLSRLIFPLAAMPKAEVRAVAARAGLSCASKPDSQEICFIPDNDYARFIENRLGKSAPGEFISPEGRPCGTHQGIIRYTVGQRKGLGIAAGRPLFVKAILPGGDVQLGEAGQEYSTRLTLTALATPDARPLPAGDYLVKIRSAAAPALCVYDGDGGVTFPEPVRAPAPGQSAVFYRDGMVYGGGVIDETF